MSELSAWDIDGTLRPGSLLADAVAHGIERGFIDPARFVDPACPSYAEVDYFIEAVTHRSRHDFKELLDRMSDEAAADIYPWAAERLLAQDSPVLISHSPDFLVKAFGRGIHVARCSGSYFHTRDLTFSGRAVTNDKARALRRYMRKAGLAQLAFAAGDSEADLPLLSKAEHSVVVNPGPHLTALALSHGWEVVTTDE